MKRKLKFRIWDLDSKTWKTDEEKFAVSLSGELMVNHFFYDDGDDYYDEDQWTEIDRNVIIQQFTGLLDKNDKEIYEGDILQDIWYESDSILYEVRFGDFFNDVNEYSGNGFYLNPITKNMGLSIHSRNTLSDLKIVGNIFENPELFNNK